MPLVCLGKMKSTRIALLPSTKRPERLATLPYNVGSKQNNSMTCWEEPSKSYNSITMHHISQLYSIGLLVLPCCLLLIPSSGVTCHQRPCWSPEGAWRTPYLWGRFSSAGRELTTLKDKRWTPLKCWIEWERWSSKINCNYVSIAFTDFLCNALKKDFFNLNSQLYSGWFVDEKTVSCQLFCFPPGFPPGCVTSAWLHSPWRPLPSLSCASHAKRSWGSANVDSWCLFGCFQK